MTSRASIAGALMFVALLATSGRARADPVSYELDYSSVPGCPDQTEFTREISSRTRNAVYVTTGGERLFVVRLSHSGTHAEGELVIGSTEAPRRVSGATCAAVGEAMALIIALLIDPTLALDLNPKAPEPAPPQSPPLARLPAPAADRTARATEPLQRSELMFALGAGGFIIDGPAPDPLYGASVFGELGSYDRRTLGPSLRLVLTHATTFSVDVGSGAARFELSSARLEGCPGGLGNRELEIAACLDLEAGRARAEGLARGEIRQTQVSARLWLETGLMTRLAWSPIEPLRFELSAGVGVPLTRRAYTFENPKETIHEPPLVVARVGLGLGAALP